MKLRDLSDRTARQDVRKGAARLAPVRDFCFANARSSASANAGTKHLASDGRWLFARLA
jgi:hypothetical protein